MQEPGVDADHERGAGDEPRHAVERRALRHPRAACHRGDPLRPRPLGFGAERNDQIDVGRERRRQQPPAILRPKLRRPGSGVQQHRIGQGAGFREARAIEPEVGCAHGRIIQGVSGQRAVARDRMLVPCHWVAHVIEQRGGPLPDALRVIAVVASLRATRAISADLNRPWVSMTGRTTLPHRPPEAAMSCQVAGL